MTAVAKLDEIMLKLQSTSLFTPVTESPPAIIPAKTSYRRSVFTIRLNTPPSTIASSDNQIAMSHIPTPPSVNDTKDSHDTKLAASNLKKSKYTTAQAVKLINVYGQEIRIPVLSGAPCVPNNSTQHTMTPSINQENRNSLSSIPMPNSDKPPSPVGLPPLPNQKRLSARGAAAASAPIKIPKLNQDGEVVGWHFIHPSGLSK
ncbi:hypothetical protein BJ741DRAFT_705088 [Chytriomyces cf. hyalinus JEL632]|nr:hypothetical protein BJ741DRAFT_705088 [Chytriomyces cf. hyalinus JEL632]